MLFDGVNASFKCRCININSIKNKKITFSGIHFRNALPEGPKECAMKRTEGYVYYILAKSFKMKDEIYMKDH